MANLPRSKIARAAGTQDAAPVIFSALPAEGEAFLSAKKISLVLDVSESTWWAWVAEPDFPVQPVRRGERYTRFKLSELRAWMQSLSAGDAKETPRQRSKAAAALAGSPP